MFKQVRNILFDLDGTLVDTAPDMAHAINLVRQEYGMSALDYSLIRPVVSLGATAMINVGFNITNSAPEFETIRQKFLDKYSENIFYKTKFFDGMEVVLDKLEKHALHWGIVTNKPAWLTTPLMEKMQLSNRAGCIVSGDTLAVSKPNPEPLLYACKLLNCTPADAVYIGDAKRDIEAGQRAEMPTIVAGYGYIETDTDVDDWEATASIHAPMDILSLLNIL
ncbi:MAG: 2-phosphoglycolate phosphatase [Gammaproteobacteria bacterium]|jgi:2-phosphoglycolate phosphatase